MSAAGFVVPELGRSPAPAGREGRDSGAPGVPPAQPKRVAVLVSGGGTNLQALIDARDAGRLPGARLVLVLSSRAGAPALKRAERAGIPAVVLERARCKRPADFDEALLGELGRHRVDVVVLAGFMSILGPRVLAAYPGGIINVHPSLIPAFCGPGWYGLKVHEAALDRGVKLSGATVHFVNSEVDGGAIIAQKAVKVLPEDTPQTLQRRVMEEAEWKLLPAALQALCSGELALDDEL